MSYIHIPSENLGEKSTTTQKSNGTALPRQVDYLSIAAKQELFANQNSINY